MSQINDCLQTTQCALSLTDSHKQLNRNNDSNNQNIEQEQKRESDIINVKAIILFVLQIT